MPAEFSGGGFLWTRIDTRLGHVQAGPIAAVGAWLLMVSLPFESTAGGTLLSHATLWWSPDGRGWAEAPDSPALSGRPNWSNWVLGLVPHGSGLIAVGLEQYLDGSSANAEAWVSRDGRTWARAVVGAGTGETMNFAYPASGGLVAIGTDGYSFHAGMERGTAIWTSTDGTRWLRLPQAKVPANVSIRSVAFGHGRYVAVGQMLPPFAAPEGSVPIWTSSDGIHFRGLRRSPGDPPAAALLGSITWTGSAFVAVGTVEGVGAFAWRSTDGLTWEQTELAGTSSGPDQPRAWGVVPTSGGLLAVGMMDREVGGPAPAAWLSIADGRRWQSIALPPALDGVSLSAAEISGGHIFVTGNGGSSGASLLWILFPFQAGMRQK